MHSQGAPLLPGPRGRGRVVMERKRRINLQNGGGGWYWRQDACDRTIPSFTALFANFNGRTGGADLSGKNRSCTVPPTLVTTADVPPSKGPDPHGSSHHTAVAPDSFKVWMCERWSPETQSANLKCRETDTWGFFLGWTEKMKSFSVLNVMPLLRVSLHSALVYGDARPVLSQLNNEDAIC